MLSIGKNYTHILAPAAGYGKDITLHIAAKLDVAQIGDITAEDSGDMFERPIYAGNAIATVQPADPINVTKIRTPASIRAQPKVAAQRARSSKRQQIPAFRSS